MNEFFKVVFNLKLNIHFSLNNQKTSKKINEISVKMKFCSITDIKITFFTKPSMAVFKFVHASTCCISMKIN